MDIQHKPCGKPLVLTVIFIFILCFSYLIQHFLLILAGKNSNGSRFHAALWELMPVKCCLSQRSFYLYLLFGD